MPLASFYSRVDGRNADVRIYRDRVETATRKLPLWWKIVLLCCGIGFFMPSVYINRVHYEVIPLQRVTSVTVRRDTFFFSIVVIVSAGNTIELRTFTDSAHRAAHVIQNLIV